MLGATVLELAKNHDAITTGRVGWSEIGIGFVTAFLVAIVVIKWFVGIVSKHGFAPFAWYRIVAGISAIAWLSLR
jgi:undecaprenyl-diphosphatase